MILSIFDFPIGIVKTELIHRYENACPWINLRSLTPQFD